MRKREYGMQEALANGPPEEEKAGIDEHTRRRRQTRGPKTREERGALHSPSRGGLRVLKEWSLTEVRTLWDGNQGAGTNYYHGTTVSSGWREGGLQQRM